MTFELLTIDGTTECVEGADTYQLEGPLTTFFVASSAHGQLSSWSVRVASFRTDRLLAIRRVERANVDTYHSASSDRTAEVVPLAPARTATG